jgi:alkanesulfonate monooxygenase SsuD/methylene tetrahydromethanopterin reductase-like flavin-dependent oxidoreductase (luciferase family)
VVPLHHPEEWAVVHNLSNGRVGIAAASSWADVDQTVPDPAVISTAR